MSCRLPEDLKPILERVRSRIPRRDVPLDFWKIDHGPSILDAFLDLSSELALSDLAESEVPEGYVMLALLFEWEADAQADGWSALQEASPTQLERILELYDRVGLPEEAQALRAARSTALQTDDLDAISAAYDSQRHEYSGDLDRLEYLTQWFCDHAQDIFYESGT